MTVDDEPANILVIKQLTRKGILYITCTEGENQNNKPILKKMLNSLKINQ